MTSILVKGVLLGGKETDIFIDGDRIAAIGGRHKAEHVIDGRGKAAIAGLINAHTHSAMSLLRGYADDMLLQEWLTKHIWPLEAKMSADDVYWGTRLACLEMIKSGTTTFNDMYWHYEGTLKAAQESGMRGYMGDVFIDMFEPGGAKEQRRKIERQLKETKRGGRLKMALGPHALYTVTEESLRWFREFSDKHELLIHIHLSETKQEVDDCVAAHGKRPVEYLNDIGFLGPNVVCAHCVWLSGKEMELMGKNHVKAVHCPTSNMKLAVGQALDYAGLRKAGVTVALGTDGCSSNNNLDMFGAMKFAALLAKMSANDPTALPAPQALRMATEEGAKALRIDAGRIEVGALADIALIDLKRPELTPLHSLTSNIVYSASGGCVDTVICDGRILMQGGIVEGEDMIMEKAAQVSANLMGRR